MIKYLIIDDEIVAHDIIKGYCDMLPNLKLVKNCYDAIEALEFLNSNKVDLIFLDLNLPKIKGFDFLKTLTDPPQIIVTTAYKEFALEGYELNITDYLLKPFGFDRFLKAINKTTVNKKPNSQTIIANPTVNSLFLKTEKKYMQIGLDAILFAEASSNYTKIQTVNDSILVREKFSELVNMLPEGDFVQVHKSFLVSTQHITSIEGNQIKIDNHIIPVGKVFKMNVNELLKK